MSEELNAPAGDFWHVDPRTLREVLSDPLAALVQAREGTPTERIGALLLLERFTDAENEATELLRDADNRFGPLLLLAHVYLRQYRWREAAELQEEALQLARTRKREALVRHHIGRRLFEEGRYRAAAQEFEWAYDLRRVTGGHSAQAEMSFTAMNRARECAGGDTPRAG